MTSRKLIISLAVIVVLIILALGLFFILKKIPAKNIEVENLSSKESKVSELPAAESEQIKKSPISGLPCQNYNHRPIAVMLSEDSAARPLSGLTDADLVIEMPVITNTMTRLMAVYVCGQPQEIGSVRSARHDFIPLAMGLDAIFAHWGGSHFALDKLNAKIMDNIDGLPNPYDAFYRKSNVPMPHNGFTSIERLDKAAGQLSFRLDGKFEGYPHFQVDSQQTIGAESKNLLINYPYPCNVRYKYQPETNTYLRFRAGQPEMDKLSDKQVEAKNIVIMRAASRQIEGPYYNDVDVEGQGSCQIYQNGKVVECAWQKDKQNQASKLFFYDKNGQEIKFVPGQIWIEIIEPDQKIVWQ